MTSDRITKVETAVVSMCDNTLATSYGPSVKVRDHVFVRIWSSTGEFGLGEASPLPHFTGEMAMHIHQVIDQILGPSLIGLNPLDLQMIDTVLAERLPGHSTAKSALVTAAYDLAGKLLGMPVWRLLGGKWRSEVELAAGVGISSVETTLAEVEGLVAQGIGTIKLKIGKDYRRDIAAIYAVREKFPHLNIRADANQGYTPKLAMKVLKELEAADLQYVEQPVAADDLQGLRRVASVTSIPIAVDEALYSLNDAINLAVYGAADVFVIKLIKTGGIRRARAIMDLAACRQIPCVLVSPYEGYVGMAADVHVAATGCNCQWAAELGLGVPVEGEPCTGLSFDGGVVQVPDRPGLGVELVTDIFAGSSG